MDNLTHSLVGGLIGLLAAKSKKYPKIPFVITGMISANFPDLDMLYASLISQPFGYLLHHRGHTHTLIGALLCSILTVFLTIFICKLRKIPFEKSLIFPIAITSVIGGMSHILLDWLNTYGVHPFWPISNEWFYGDTIFIIEPTLWFSLCFAIYALVESKTAKIFSMIPVVIGVILIIFSGKVNPTIGMVIIISFLSVFLALHFTKSFTQTAIWIITSFLIIFTFKFAGFKALQILKNTQDKTLVAFVQPAPSNPFCWTSMEMVRKDDLVVYRRASIQPFNSIIDVNCNSYSLVTTGTSADISIPLKTFKDLSENCRWKAFLQFSRVPGIIQCGASKCANDFRFSRNRTSNFSTLSLDGDCPDLLPPWNPPVKDIN